MNSSTKTGSVWFSILLLICVIGVGLAARVPERAFAAAEPAALEIRGFHLLSAADGWLWVGQQVYWSHDAGAHWFDITPPNFERAIVRGVFFSDILHGWLVAIRPDSAGAPAWVLARTPDGGRSWQITALSLFGPDEAGLMAGAVTLDFINPQAGWLVVERTSGSAFSEGALFRTADGGQTWLREALPGGNPVYFATSAIGWTTAGPLGDQLYRSADGGRSWSRQTVGVGTASPGVQDTAARRLRYHLPAFDNPRDGVLPIIVSDGAELRVNYYVTADGGESWQSAVSVPIESGVAGGTHIPLSTLSSRRWLLASPAGGRLLDVLNRQEVTVRPNIDGRAAGIVTLDMATPAAGWAELRSGSCERRPDGQTSCARQDVLLHTTDAGRTWQTVPLPSRSGSRSPQAPAETQLAAGQGIDACFPGSVAEMQTWFATSPYSVVNLYIGGSSLYAGCTQLTPSFVTALAEQGWTLIPTWVGPQAPCTAYHSQFPYDTTVAQTQGISEANAAIDSAAALGLTLPDRSATIIYYDLEYFNTADAACREAAKAFVSGWSGQLRARANKAGVYAVSSVMSDYSAIPNVPDDIWMAQWASPPFVYSPTASVWNVPYVSNALWVNHQRLHQYAGGHDETWGGVTLNVDSDVLDARLAALPCYALSAGVSASAAGAASPLSAATCTGGYFANSIVQLQATPNNGYLFTGWSGEAASPTNPLTVYVDGNKSYVANFAAIQSRIFIPYVQHAP